MTGYRCSIMPRAMPLATNTSNPFTDDARTLTRTSPGSGSGVGTSITAAGDPSSVSPNAFMLPPSPRGQFLLWAT